MKRGLALEGGGARGAYHIGVAKALFEYGYEFEGFVGTSIGAINAAILAEGDFDIALELWANISLDQLFDDAYLPLLKHVDSTNRARFISGVRNVLSIMRGGGLNTDRFRGFFCKYIDEERIRNSGKDFGLVTILLDGFEPLELMLEDIPAGELCEYTMASASYPLFQREVIEDQVFLDGAFYDNCPYHLLLAKGYDEIIVVRTNARGRFHKITDTDKIKVIAPCEDLGHVLQFSPERCMANIDLGFFDGLRFMRNLRGHAYYIEPIPEERINTQLMKIPDELIIETGKALNIQDMPARRMLYEKIIPKISAQMKLSKDHDYTDVVTAILECMAERRGIKRLQIYDYERLRALIKESPDLTENNKIQSIAARMFAGGKKKTVLELLGSALVSDEPGTDVIA